VVRHVDCAEGNLVKCCRHLTTLLVGVAMLAGLVGSTPRSAGAASCGAGSSPTTGLVRDAHPVVLVHGWTGGVMQATRTKLEAKIGKGWQFLLFDYHGASALWASSPRIAGCLATYLKAVSDAHVKAGGDGMVYVVAHSMGGLALRFAADPRYGKIAGLADHIGGLVTLATPHRGTPWGNSGVYVQLANLKNTLLLDAAPKGQEATRCLAPQDAGGGLPAGCDAPPYLPLKVRIDQIAGAATVRRTFFGLHAYDILLGGDSIVPQLSAQGYLRSAQGSTVGMSARSTQVSCAIDADAFGAVLGGGVLGTIARLKIDGAAMDAIQGDRTSPALLEFLLAANTAMPCSHVGITKFDAAIDQTVTALRNDAKANSSIGVHRLSGRVFGRIDSFSAADGMLKFDLARYLSGRALIDYYASRRSEWDELWCNSQYYNGTQPLETCSLVGEGQIRLDESHELVELPILPDAAITIIGNDSTGATRAGTANELEAVVKRNHWGNWFFLTIDKGGRVARVDEQFFS
jgi:hypothetical protein